MGISKASTPSDSQGTDNQDNDASKKPPKVKRKYRRIDPALSKDERKAVVASRKKAQLGDDADASLMPERQTSSTQGIDGSGHHNSQKYPSNSTRTEEESGNDNYSNHINYSSKQDMPGQSLPQSRSPEKTDAYSSWSEISSSQGGVYGKYVEPGTEIVEDSKSVQSGVNDNLAIGGQPVNMRAFMGVFKGGPSMQPRPRTQVASLPHGVNLEAMIQPSNSHRIPAMGQATGLNNTPMHPEYHGASLTNPVMNQESNSYTPIHGIPPPHDTLSGRNVNEIHPHSTNAPPTLMGNSMEYQVDTSGRQTIPMQVSENGDEKLSFEAIEMLRRSTTVGPPVSMPVVSGTESKAPLMSGLQVKVLAHVSKTTSEKVTEDQEEQGPEADGCEDEDEHALMEASTPLPPKLECTTIEKWTLDQKKRKQLEEENWVQKQSKTEERIAERFHQLKVVQLVEVMGKYGIVCGRLYARLLCPDWQEILNVF
jgi:hypothetical protein